MLTHIFTSGKIVKTSNDTQWKKTCVFIGENDYVPQIDSYIVVKEGYGLEQVKSVYYNMISKTLEIELVTDDKNNAYPDVWDRYYKNKEQ